MRSRSTRRDLVRFSAATLALIASAAVGPASAQTRASDLPAAVSRDGAPDVAAFRLLAGDAVRLLVRDEPELAGEYPVLEDGTVLLPMIGLVAVAGEEFSSVVARVRGLYAKELVGATVVLQPLIRVRVLGEVRLPGLYLVDATYGVRDVLAQAGGTSPSAAAGRVQLVRNGAAQTLDLEHASESQQPVMQPGDELIVPRRSWVRENLPILVGAGTSVVAAALTAWLVR